MGAGPASCPELPDSGGPTTLESPPDLAALLCFPTPAASQEPGGPGTQVPRKAIFLSKKNILTGKYVNLPECGTSRGASRSDRTDP